jgi:hypothetical protein
MTESVPPDVETALGGTCAAFNARDIDAALVALREDADWPNMIGGTRAVGHDEVRCYWSRQFREIDSHVEPKRFGVDPEGRIIVGVHQVLRDRDGSLLDDRMVRHVYTVSKGLIMTVARSSSEEREQRIPQGGHKED